MNQIVLKQTAILSAIIGLILGVITLIPFVRGFSFLLLILAVSAVVLIYMKKNELIGIIDIREGAILGAIIGFISFLTFSVIFIPIAAIIGSIFKTYYLGWLTMLLKASGFFVLIMLVVFVATLSALMNAFAGLVTAYIYEVLSGMKKEDSESIDFEIKE